MGYASTDKGEHTSVSWRTLKSSSSSSMPVIARVLLFPPPFFFKLKRDDTFKNYSAKPCCWDKSILQSAWLKPHCHSDPAGFIICEYIWGHAAEICFRTRYLPLHIWSSREDEKCNTTLEQPCFSKSQNSCSNKRFFSSSFFSIAMKPIVSTGAAREGSHFQHMQDLDFKFSSKFLGEKRYWQISENLIGEELELLFPQPFSFVLAFSVLF